MLCLRRLLQWQGQDASSTMPSIHAISDYFWTACALTCWQAAKITDGEGSKALCDACDECCKACNGVRTQSMALLASQMVLVVATQVGSTAPPYTHLFVNETAILPGLPLLKSR
jgi:hypothetical protein